jgi:sarcosine oxidase subunit beta
LDEPAEMIDGAIFTPLAGYVTDPQLSCHNVQRAAESHGAEFRFNTEVADIRKEGNRVKGITLKSGEEIDAPVVVNVAGPHSFIINRMAGVEDDMNIKTKAMRQEVCHVPSPEGFDYEKDGCVASDGDIGCYSRPEVGNHILIGSEDPDCDTLEYVDPDNYNQELTEAQWKAQVYRMAKRLPSLPIPNQMQGIVDLYDASDDWIPLYDKTKLDGYYMAIGTSGNQYKNAPVVGKMMTELIARCEAGHDHDADPIQYKMEITGRIINLAFYSRKREINPESSFSVIG